MKKLLLLISFCLLTSINHQICAYSNAIEEKFAGNVVGNFYSGGIEYIIWAYLPSSNIVKITSNQVTPPYTFSSPTFSGYWYTSSNNLLSANVMFVDGYGNTVNYNGLLHQSP